MALILPMRPLRTSSQAWRKFSTDRCQLPVCQMRPWRSLSSHHGEALAEVVRQRLLAVDVLLGARRLGGHDAVPVVGQRDADRVHVAPHQHLFEGMIGRATLVAVSRCQPAPFPASGGPRPGRTRRQCARPSISEIPSGGRRSPSSPGRCRPGKSGRSAAWLRPGPARSPERTAAPPHSPTRHFAGTYVVSDCFRCSYASSLAH